ncbi:hypothetical protein [Nocardioides mangrovi]|uniref:Uncharacterized protein n=1 Tax=Nocardioides mangrovi TaxID=2874580 RepID=A0ABS7U7U2_9ACTN|nr:hypothetical protein [Nocardioides mangrovi]MBZ5736806.1 hypothetical protein [Nocardioides mangrovi]
MSIAPAAPVPPPTAGEPAPLPRVRHQARDAATLMAFSALTSIGVALGFLLLAVAARQA